MMVIRPYSPFDLAAIQAVSTAALSPGAASLRNPVGADIAASRGMKSGPGLADVLDGIDAINRVNEIAVAEWDGKVAGFVSWKVNRATRIGELTLNIVHPDYADKGLGAALHEHALDALQAAGMSLSTFGAGTYKNNDPARPDHVNEIFGMPTPSTSLHDKH
jgi:GNAT superfamily N-acetyltransferase